MTSTASHGKEYRYRKLGCRCDACMVWQKERQRRMRLKYPERRKRYKRTSAARRRAKLTATIATLKDQPCTDCRQRYIAAVMEFDHVRGSKRKDVSRAKTLASALQEITKCELVCANCHRVRTYERAQARQRMKSISQAFKQDTSKTPQNAPGPTIAA